MHNEELANRVFDSLSDGYDDEEGRDEVVESLIEELNQLPNSSCLRIVVEQLCERIDELLEFDYEEYEFD